MRLKSGRRLNEMDAIFYSHSRLEDGLYRFAGCFECSAGELTPDEVRAAISEVMIRYPEVFLVDPAGDRTCRVDERHFATPADLEEFYRASLSGPVRFGNTLVQAALLTKPDGARALFLLIPHFAGDSKIASFILGHILRASSEPLPEQLLFVSYRELVGRNIRGFANVVRSLWRELVEMGRSFALRSPRKGRMGIATVFLDAAELRSVNSARRALSLSRSQLIQVAALHAYRTVAGRELARVFNVIYDNTPDVPTVNNCFRSMPLVVPRRAGPSTLESCRDLFNRLTALYARPYNRHAFLFRSLLVSCLPLALLGRVFARFTRAVQHYLSYVFLDGKIEVDPKRLPDLRMWGNIEPVGYSLSNFNAVEIGKQISLNITWDIAALGPAFGGELLAAIRACFAPGAAGGARANRDEDQT